MSALQDMVDDMVAEHETSPADHFPELGTERRAEGPADDTHAGASRWLSDRSVGQKLWAVSSSNIAVVLLCLIATCLGGYFALEARNERMAISSASIMAERMVADIGEGRLFVQRFAVSGDPNDLDNFIDRGARKANIWVQMKGGDNQQMQAFLINHQLDDIKSTFYRQTMFAEFERTIHELDESGSPLTVDEYRRVYRELLQKYFGAAVTLSDVDDLECFRIPHFYSAFYVYKYATSLSAAIALAERVSSGEEGAVDGFLAFLGAGSHKEPLAILKDAGVDLTGKEVYEVTVNKFRKLLEEYKSL